MMRRLLFLLMSLPVFSLHAASVEINASGLLREQAEEALNLLPENYLGAIDKTIKIEEKSLETDVHFTSEDLCRLDVKAVSGSLKKNTITISARLVELAETIEKEFNCGHRTFKRHLLATLIHELTHVKDNAEKISTLPDFQRIVGMKKVQFSSKKKVGNRNAVASPDAYEFENLEESLAVNTEFLVLDPEFECRKPATANFLASKLGIELKQECKKNYNVMAQSGYIEDNYLHTFNLDPKRIYQVHYLFAGKGRAIMSRWGHAMFRLVVCAPHRKVVGPECLDDVSYHVALTYRAAISDMNLSYTKGMFGKYPSQLFIMRFHEIQQEYTKYELRDLFSVPLKMSASQKNEFIDLTLERYWTYQGSYYFFSNNCGTETVKHLAAVLDEEQAKLIGSITPLKIYNDIVKKGNDLTDGDYNDLDREEMVEKKILIKSMHDEYNSTYLFLKALFSSFEGKNVHKFIETTLAAKRYGDYQKFFAQNEKLDDSKKKQILLKIDHIERYLSGRTMKAIPQKAMALMDKDPELKTEVLKMGQGLQALNLQPWEVVSGRYGVPSLEEYTQNFSSFTLKRKNEVKNTVNNQMENLQVLLGKKYFQAELKEIEDLKKIKTFTSEQIKKLHKL